jgi:hypothetical protein
MAFVPLCIRIYMIGSSPIGSISSQGTRRSELSLTDHRRCTVSLWPSGTPTRLLELSERHLLQDMKGTVDQCGDKGPSGSSVLLVSSI